MSRYRTFVFAAPFAALLISAIWCTGAILTGCHSNANGGNSLGDSFFPLAKGNRWVFAWFEHGREMGHDTVTIDMAAVVDGVKYYRAQAHWPGFAGGLWIRRDAAGNLGWVEHPGQRQTVFLYPSAKVGERWATGFAADPCADTFAMSDDYAIIATPYGLFDGTRQISAVNQCADNGWGISLARGIGPVSWEAITIAGPRHWLLIAADIHDDPLNPRATARVVDGD
ncbi:MAG: hypothetical protein AB1792_11310 [Candidatus Zixiibacteriota bacterium]